jgi:ribonuclease R
LDFDLPEPKVVLDEDDPLAVRDVRRAKPDRYVQRAYQLIEECMVAANQAVGRFCAAHSLPVIWRVHERPVAARFQEFKALARVVGVVVKGKRPDSRTLQAALRRIAGHRAHGPLSLALLRCLAQAMYSDENLGHFALAAPSYLHFTSPIRRYPDLVTHRVVKHYLARTRGDPQVEDAPPPSAREVARLAEHCSGMEQRSSAVERQVVDVYRAFVMREHLDQVLRGRIVGVKGFGLFVQLDEPFADGLLPVQELGADRFDTTPEGASLVGRRSDVRYTLGQPLDVRVVEVSVTQRQVRFALAHPPLAARSPRRRGRRGRPPPRRSRHTGRGRGGKRRR